MSAAAPRSSSQNMVDGSWRVNISGEAQSKWPRWDLLQNMPRRGSSLPSGFSWDHLPDKRLALKSLSQDLLWEDPTSDSVLTPSQQGNEKKAL